MRLNILARVSSSHGVGPLLLLALLGHTLLWLLLPALLQPNANLDVVEGFAWGQQWQLGYDKHPPLAPWLTYAVSQLSPGSHWPVFLLSQLAIVIALLTHYRLARQFITRPQALACTLLVTLIPYFNYQAIEFNPNVLQLPIWSLGAFYTFKALQTQRLTAWLMLGFLAGLALLTKYFAVVLLASISCLWLFHCWRTRQVSYLGPAIALAVCLSVWLANLLWLAEHQFSAVQYGVARGSHTSTSLLAHLQQPLVFLVEQVLFLTLVFIALWRSTHYPRAASRPSPARAYVSIIAFGPLVFTLLISVISGMQLRTLWGTPLLTFIPLWLVTCGRLSFSGRKLLVAWLCGQVLLVAFYCYEMQLAPRLGKAKKRAHFPGKALATELSQAWQSRYQQRLNYVVGSIWLAGNIAYYSKQQPAVLFEANLQRSPWIDIERLERQGALVLWDDSSAKERSFYHSWLKQYPRAQRQTPLVLPWQLDSQTAPLQIGWAILPPQSSAAKPSTQNNVCNKALDCKRWQNHSSASPE